MKLNCFTSEEDWLDETKSHIVPNIAEREEGRHFQCARNSSNDDDILSARWRMDRWTHGRRIFAARSCEIAQRLREKLSLQSGASYLSQDFVMFFHASCEGLPGQ